MGLRGFRGWGRSDKVVLESAWTEEMSSDSILEDGWEHMGEGCWHHEQQLWRGKYFWLAIRQMFEPQGNCPQRVFIKVKLRHQPCREEKREMVTANTLELEPESCGSLGSRDSGS